MISGVYSTVCIASQLWLDWQQRKKTAGPQEVNHP